MISSCAFAQSDVSCRLMPTVTRSELLEFAAGLDVSERQLKRWRRRGLLPTPELKSQGRARGMVAYYPADVRQQLVDLCRHRSRFRSLQTVGWALWCQGYSVDRFGREVMEKCVEIPANIVTHALERFEAEDPDNPITRSESIRLPKQYAAIRRRVGRQRMSTVAWHGLSLLAGNVSREDPFEPDGQAIVVKGLSALSELDTNILAEEHWQGWAKLTSHVNLPRILKLLREAPDEAYRECRSDCLKGLDWANRELGLPKYEPIPPIVFLVWFCLLNWSEESRKFATEALADFPRVSQQLGYSHEQRSK